MAEGLKNKTISGMLWSSVGKFGTMGLQFLSNLVLARLLMPSDYGAIGMLQVFIAVSGIFVTAGFGSALIQKKNPTHVDYTSVFYWNLAASVFFYVILFFSGPAIAKFYEMPELCAILRVQSLSLIIQAFSTVQSNQLQKQLRFKELSIRNIIATLIGTLVAIVMAFFGYGVWSLVASNLVSSLFGVLLLWKMSIWRPSWEFSWQSLKELFSFGGLMALSSFVETLYTNLQSLIIGKWFSPSDLGYFTQAKKLGDIPTTTLAVIVNEVTFPVFSEIQDEKEKLVYGLKKNVSAITFITFPMMILLIVIAKPLILLLYGAKWETSVVFFQILCLGSMLYSHNSLNTNICKALGKSNVYFWLQLSKRLIGIGMIVFGIRFGIYGLLWSVASFYYVAFVINGIVNHRLINYGVLKQIKDIGPALVISIIAAVVCVIINKLFPMNLYLMMVIQIIIFILLYFVISGLFRIDGYNIYKGILLEKIPKLNKKNQ